MKSYNIFLILFNKFVNSFYIYYKKKLYNDRDELQAAEARGKEQGIAEGEARGKAELIKMMIKTGHSIEKIAEITGLSLDEVKKLT